MPKNEMIKIGDGVYQLKYYWLGIANVYCYLIVGSQSALLIDSGYASTGAKNYVKRITDKPIILVNTHGHFDHIGGNGDFKEAYLSTKDMAVAKEHSLKEGLERMMEDAQKHSFLFQLIFSIPILRKKAMRSLDIGNIKWRDLPECGYFDLGDRRVSFIEVPGHTPGCICIFDEKSKYLFPGDSLCETGALLGFDYSSSVSEFKNSITKMQDFAEKKGVTNIYPSHHETPVSKTIFDKYISLCNGIMEKKIIGKPHNDGLTSGYKAQMNKLALVYRKI